MKTTGKTWMDGTKARSSVIAWTPVSPKKVFAYVAELTRHSDWALDEISVTPVMPGPVKLGSKYKAVGKQIGKEWPSDLEVAAFEPFKRFEFTATGGPLDVPKDDPHRHEFLFEPENGGTRIELRRTDPKPPSWPDWFMRVIGSIILRISLRKRIQTVEKLVLQLENRNF